MSTIYRLVTHLILEVTVSLILTVFPAAIVINDDSAPLVKVTGAVAPTVKVIVALIASSKLALTLKLFVTVHV